MSGASSNFAVQRPGLALLAPAADRCVSPPEWGERVSADELRQEMGGDPMTGLASDHVAAAKRLFQSVAGAALVAEKALPEIYTTLRLGRGFLWRNMSDQVKAETAIEVWAYLSALLVSMAEAWPGRPAPADLEVIIRALEGALLEVQRINYRPEYEAYRLRFREGRSSLGVADPKIFGPMYGLHEELHVRLALAWSVPPLATVSPYAPSWTQRRAARTRDAFIAAMSEMTKKLEDELRKGLEELWPPR